jgi:hypothetical protein
VWGVGCGVWGFIDFQVVKYLIFREKVQEFSPRSPQWLALFEGKKVQKSYPTRFLDLFSRPYLWMKLESFQIILIVSKSIVKYRQTEFHFRNSLQFYFERLILLG